MCRTLQEPPHHLEQRPEALQLTPMSSTWSPQTSGTLVSLLLPLDLDGSTPGLCTEVPFSQTLCPRCLFEQPPPCPQAWSSTAPLNKLSFHYLKTTAHSHSHTILSILSLYSFLFLWPALPGCLCMYVCKCVCVHV